MVQRPGRGAFPDLHVFPGGKVDEEDWCPQLCDNLDDADASARLGVRAGGLRYWVAVARECFEECGVLLARRQGRNIDFSQPGVRAHYADQRQRLLRGELGFVDLCHQEGLTVAGDLLAYFSHWITPEMAPRRFNTRFFLAAMPPNQSTLAHAGEAADEAWVSPRAALDLHLQQRWQMIDPTLRSLETLCQFSSVSEALDRVNCGDHLMPLTDELHRQGMQVLR